MKFQKEREALFMMQQTYASLFATVNKLQASADASTNGLTSRQYILLTTIHKMAPEEATLNNIAAQMSTSKQNVNKLVTSLANKGFVKITPSKSDKRAVNASVTKKGEKSIAKCANGMNHFYAELFSKFSIAEVEELQALIGKLAAFDGEPIEQYESENLKGNMIEDDDEEFEEFLKEFSRGRKKIERK